MYVRHRFVRSWLAGLGALALSANLVASVASAATLGYTTNLKLWLKADAGVTADGAGDVSQWNDFSGNSHDGTVSNTAPNVIPGALNGLPVIRFNGASDSLILGNGAVQSSSDFTIFAVANSTATGGLNRAIYANWNFSDPFGSVFMGVIANSAIDQPVRLTPTLTSNSLVNPSTHFRLKGVYNTTGGTSDVYQDEVLFGTGGATPRSGAADSYIGVQGELNQEFWDGDIAELLIYDHVLNAADTAAVESYLTAKWFTPVPEPSSVMLLGCGVLALAVGRRLSRRFVSGA